MTTTETPVTCPPSAVRDQTLHWFEVPAGELVLFDGKFRLLEHMWPAYAGTFVPRRSENVVGIELRYGGEVTRHHVDSNDLVTVRRYDTGEGA